MDKESLYKALSKVAQAPSNFSKSHGLGTVSGFQNLMKKASEGKLYAESKTDKAPSK